MQQQQLKVSLNNFQWNYLSNALSKFAEHAPIQNMPCESLVLAELYRKKIGFFTFFKPVGKFKLATLTLMMYEAYALHICLSKFGDGYNIFLRMQVEPYLSPAKQLKNG